MESFEEIATLVLTVGAAHPETATNAAAMRATLKNLRNTLKPRLTAYDALILVEESLLRKGAKLGFCVRKCQVTAPVLTVGLSTSIKRASFFTLLTLERARALWAMSRRLLKGSLKTIHCHQKLRTFRRTF